MKTAKNDLQSDLQNELRKELRVARMRWGVLLGLIGLTLWGTALALSAQDDPAATLAPAATRAPELASNQADPVPEAAAALIHAFNEREAQVRADATAEISTERENLHAQLKELHDKLKAEGQNDAAAAIANWLTADDESVATPAPSWLDGGDYVMGRTYRWTLTGEVRGTIWGNGVYTDDSDLVSAAVHSGTLAVGETAEVLVTIMPGQAGYRGTESNGIQSYSWGGWDRSFRMQRPVSGDEEASGFEGFGGLGDLGGFGFGIDTGGRFGWTSRITMTEYRGEPGRVVELEITGSTEGIVWGSGTYTDDSDVATAAVHAGILEEGETATVSVRVLAGREIYEGSEANGVTSYDYEDWQGSYQFVADTSVR